MVFTAINCIYMIAMFRYCAFSVLLFFFYIQPVQAQMLYGPLSNPAATPSGMNSNHNTRGIQSVSIPITMQGAGLFAVHSFSFILHFNSNQLQLQGVEGIAVSNVSASGNGNTLIINWNNPSNPVNFVESTHVLDVHFVRIAPGDVAFTFLPGSKVGSNLGLLPVTFTNGSLIQTWDLTLDAVPVQGGITSGSGTYVPGETIALQAAPNAGYLFQNWTLNGQAISSNPNFSYTMPNANTNLKANFTAKSYQLTLQSLPANGGSTSGAGFYDFGQMVQVNAVPSTGYQFTNWTKNGEVVSISPQFNFPMPAGDVGLWANFEAIHYPLTLVASPVEGGTVNGAGNFNYNQNVTVTAIPSMGYHFVAWTKEGNVVSNNATYSFAMPANALQLTARFLLNTYTIEIQPNNTSFGSVSGGGDYLHGATVNLTAQAFEEYEFVAWTEAGQTVSFLPNYSFTAVNNRDLMAFFQEIASCPTPINLLLNDLSDSTAAFTWVSPVTINQWNCLWGIALGDTLSGEGTWVETTQNSIALTNLSPNTSYVAYVQAHCLEDALSTWSEPLFFTTYYVDIKEDTSTNSWKLAPNPSTGKIVLSRPNTSLSSLQIQLFTLTGLLLESRTMDFNNKEELDFQHIENGLYILKVGGDGVNFQQKVIISQ